MASWGQLLPFGGVVALGAMAPGPDFAVVLRHSAMSGRRAGFAAALGITGGIMVWSVVAALGLASLLAASAIAYTVVKVAGAVYLVYLGVRALLAARKGEGYEAREATAEPGMAHAFRQALVTNVLNPKCAVFFVALLPQFLPAHATVGDTVLLALIPMAVTLLWFTLVANVVGAMRKLLAAKRVRRAIDAVTGTVLVALGIRIASTAQ